MKESFIESEIKKYAESKGMLFLKIQSTTNGLPDRLVLDKDGRYLWIELKRKSQKPRKLQRFWHEKLKKMNANVVVCDSIDTGKQIINRFQNER